MAKKINQEDDTKFLKEFEKLKAKHTDAMLHVSEGDFYKPYKADAVKAVWIHGIASADNVTSTITG